MSDWHCLARNPESGVSTWMRADDDDPNGVEIQTRQDVSALLDENTAQRNIASDNWKGEGLHSVARVPLAMLHDPNGPFHEAAQNGDDKHLAKVLNDSDFSKLRTKEGRL